MDDYTYETLTTERPSPSQQNISRKRMWTTIMVAACLLFCLAIAVIETVAGR